jgi:hypothetical protein
VTWLARIVGSFIAAAGVAAQSPAPSFRYERPVALTGHAPYRVDPDVALVAGAQPFSVTRAGDRFIASRGLDDLRFYDSSGIEVPYLLVPPPAGEPEWRSSRVLPVAPTRKTSGFEADFGEPTFADAIRVNGIPPPFLKRLVLEGSGDRARWTMLAAEGTLFHLPDERLEQTSLTFTAGAYRYFRVTWNDTNSGVVPLPASVEVRLASQAAAAHPPLRLPLAVERRPSEPGVSRFRVQLPASKLPVVALELDVAGGHILRSAQVSEPRLSGEQVVDQNVGEATLRRVVRDGIAADALRISIAQPREARLDVVVDDGDNPPLDVRSVTAVFAELPWIYLERGEATITARYGDPALAAPRYDLEAARDVVSAAGTAAAQWGPARALSASTAAPRPLDMPETGATLNAGDFRFSRAIPAGSGLVAVPLDAAVLAHSGALTNNFADVRVLDDGGRQVPYLLERRSEPTIVDVRLEKRDLPAAIAERYPRRSAYVVDLPYRALPSARLAVHTRAAVFERDVALGVLVSADERRRQPHVEELRSARWQHADRDVPARPLMLNVPERRTGEIVLLVDEGDNQPLPIEKVTLLLPAYALRLYRPADRPLKLVYGRDDLLRPRYDLALLAPRVLGSAAPDVYPGPEQGGRETAAPATLVSPVAFWAALALAVVVLLGLIVRLVRRDATATGDQGA